MDVIGALAELANQYGILIVVVVVLVANAKAVLGAVDKIVGRLAPAWSAHRKDTREWRQSQADRSYTDAVQALQTLLEDARTEVKSASQERRILQAYLLKHLSQYESLAGGTVTALQDISRGLQEQNERIAQLTESLRKQNGHTASGPGESGERSTP